MEQYNTDATNMYRLNIRLNMTFSSLSFFLILFYIFVLFLKKKKIKIANPFSVYANQLKRYVQSLYMRLACKRQQSYRMMRLNKCV